MRNHECSCATPCENCTCEREAVECVECGCDLVPDDVRMHKDEPYCEDCYPIIQCEDCGDDMERSDAIEIDGKLYCEDCVTKCDECGCYHRSRDNETARLSHSIRRVDLCPDCYDQTFCCECCDETVIGECYNADGDTICERCMDNYHYWCEYCETYHHEDYRCRYNHPEEREHQRRARIGVKTESFTLRTVGVEIETGEGATDSAFASCFEDSYRHWGYKGDGSLDEGGMELVSPPLGGDTIISEIKGVYRMLNNYGVDMSSEAAGCHIHVDYRDVRTKLVDCKENSKHDPGDLFLEWGTLMTEMVRFLVPRDRAINRFCAGNFGTRCDYEVAPKIQEKVGYTGYAAVAVRERTIEFRIWGVTSVPEITLARAEFSQKSVDFLAKFVDTRGKELKKLRKRLRKSLAMLKVGCIDSLRRLFGLSDHCASMLAKALRERMNQYHENHRYYYPCSSPF